MATLSIEIETLDQATQLQEMAENLLSDIDQMKEVADFKTTIYLEDIKEMWAQIDKQARLAQQQLISNLQ